MSNEYEQKIYDFFTKPDNFKSMHDVHDKYEMVNRLLVEDFWDEVKTELTDSFDQSVWNVGMSNDRSYRWNKLWLYKTAWCDGSNYPVLAIAVENHKVGQHPYIGIHFHFDRKEFKAGEIHDKLFPLLEDNSFVKDKNQQYWPAHKYLPFTHIGYQELDNLLPTNREGYIKTVIGEYQEIVDVAAEAIDEAMELRVE